MRVWYKNLSSLLGSDEAEEASVRQILEAAASQQAVIGLSQSDDVRPDPDCGILDAVDGDDLVLSRHQSGTFAALETATNPQSTSSSASPAQGAMWKPGDRVFLAVATVRGFYRGETEVISCWTGRDIGLDRCGYRVRIPESLLHSQRRSNERVPVAFDLAPRAVVKSSDAASQIAMGVVLDLSGTGMRMRVVPTREILAGELPTSRRASQARFRPTRDWSRSCMCFRRVFPTRAFLVFDSSMSAPTSPGRFARSTSSDVADSRRNAA
jgi:hypothetical protein